MITCACAGSFLASKRWLCTTLMACVSDKATKQLARSGALHCWGGCFTPGDNGLGIMLLPTTLWVAGWLTGATCAVSHL